MYCRTYPALLHAMLIAPRNYYYLPRYYDVGINHDVPTPNLAKRKWGQSIESKERQMRAMHHVSRMLMLPCCPVLADWSYISHRQIGQ